MLILDIDSGPYRNEHCYLAYLNVYRQRYHAVSSSEFCHVAHVISSKYNISGLVVAGRSYARACATTPLTAGGDR
ncbi:hypothetical protein EVAR_16932_1 [Eumeta japonica]|uniref:Uncharacterized protein n=1 Tax=Eumeta variegata TaxID=151549 RepID=A0A4C1TVQ2_EUMVA|nr:hypothetical protein EVAR_16932_1 [Eumeta japonica]